MEIVLLLVNWRPQTSPGSAGEHILLTCLWSFVSSVKCGQIPSTKKQPTPDTQESKVEYHTATESYIHCTGRPQIMSTHISSVVIYEQQSHHPWSHKLRTSRNSITLLHNYKQYLWNWGITCLKQFTICVIN